ncbi:MAG: carbamoyltransferase [Planctomycetes bacterium]|nr:carbamoyltransferase [Planctomycetota bacterium]
MPVHILGISALYHDSAAALVRDGEIVAAAQEERFTRRKHDPSFPCQAVRYCLQEGQLRADELDYAVFYDKPLLKFDRLLQTYCSFAPRGIRSFLTAMPVWLKHKLWVRRQIEEELDGCGEILFCDHHASHAASAFFPSPYEKAAILTVDGVGEWSTSAWGTGDGNNINLAGEIRFPHSLGLLYSAFTYYCGFRVNSGEYKLMGLAPYGEPRYVDLILEHIIDLKEDGSFRLNLDLFNYCTGLTMTNGRFHKLLGGLPRVPESDITQQTCDVARSIQEVTEEVMLRMARHVHERTGQRFLCLAGGVALNCVANGRILREGPFDDIWIQPAAGDAGGAVGAAFAVWHQFLGKERRCDGQRDRMHGAQLGPAFKPDQIARMLEEQRIPATRYEPEELVERVAGLIAEGRVVGWFDGRMEFGPRALGNRSILGDPRNRDMQTTLNLKIKFRESFRPFAPAVLLERVADYFELDRPSPYMLLVAPVSPSHRREPPVPEPDLDSLARRKQVRSSVPAITHVDYSARIQTVDAADNPRFHRLIAAFDRLTGCPLIINTSFNVRGEPIVGSPIDAYRCFMRTELDYLVLGDYLLSKADQPADRRAELPPVECILD